jgi:hypothetical protein
VKRTITLERLDEVGYASLYVFSLDQETESEYVKFWNKYESGKFQWEFDVIDKRIEQIIKCGAEDEHFRNEGKATKALPFDIGSRLRLYCYRLSQDLIIIGNGGIKLKNIDPEKNKTSDFPELHEYCETVRAVGLEIKRQLKTAEIKKVGNKLIGLKPFKIEIILK